MKKIVFEGRRMSWVEEILKRRIKWKESLWINRKGLICFKMYNVKFSYVKIIKLLII